MQLHKVLSKDKAVLIRSMYSEDLKYLATLDKNAALALDIGVSNALALFTSDTKFYKLEIAEGALMGWFAITPITPDSYVLTAWYIRQQCRTKDLLADFNTLIQQTFTYGHFNSTGVNNISVAVLAEQTAQQITIPTLDYSGKNMLILKTSN